MRTIKFRAWYGKSMEYDVQDVWSVHGRSFGHILQDRGTTVMQYTGLDDKNGQEIYEGDVVLAKEYIKGGVASRRKRWIIVWDPHYATGWSGERKGEYTTIIDSTLETEPEVIGNIYENPELLK